jgi:flavodoxin
MDKDKLTIDENFLNDRIVKSNKKTFITQAISQRDSSGDGNIAKPDDDNVKRARDWVNENKL